MLKNEKNQIVSDKSDLTVNSSVSTHCDDPDSHTPTLLIIEDDDEEAEQIKSIIGERLKIITATDYQDALNLLELGNIDLIAGDFIIPNNGEGNSATSILQSKIEEEKQKDEESKKHLIYELKDIGFETTDKKFLDNVVTCINRNLDVVSFDVTKFAQEMGTSKTTLYKRLKALTGMSPNSFIRNIRIKASRQILQNYPEIRINEIAYSVGFTDPKYFSICFRREFGITPREYREQFSQSSPP